MAEDWRYCLNYDEEHIDLSVGRSTIGRSRTCDVSIDDPSVSRRHVYLTVGSGKILLQDLESSNGTFVNEKRVYGQTELADGDVLRLGDATLRVELRSAAFETARIPALANQPPPGQPGVVDPAGVVSRDTVQLPVVTGEAVPTPATPRVPGTATMTLQEASIQLAQQALGADVSTLAPPLAEPPVSADTPMSETEEIPIGQLSDQLRSAAVPRAPAPPPATSPPAPRPAAAPPPSPAVPETPKVLEPEPAAATPDAESAPDDGLDAFGQPRSRGELLPSLDELDAVVGPPLSELPTAPRPAAPATAPRISPAAPFSYAPPAAPSRSPELEPAGFWRRFAAAVLDSLWTVGLSGAVFFRWGQLGGLVASVVPLLVALVGWGVWGTTPGKRLLGLYVCTAKGEVGIGIMRSAIRLAGYLVSTLTVGIGFLMVGFSDRKLALHDRIAGTWVGRRN
ncbi:MAG: FHA domain-containing protein [bacterium]|nr:FHA domain-containing protein [bacterium]